MPEEGVRYIAYCDTSFDELSYALMQEYQMVTFGLRWPKDHEHNYHTYGLKFAAIVFAPKTWCNYLYEKQFKMMLY